MYIQYICCSGWAVQGNDANVFTCLVFLWSETCILVFNGLFSNGPSDGFFSRQHKPDLKRVQQQWFQVKRKVVWCPLKLLFLLPSFSRAVGCYLHGCCFVLLVIFTRGVKQEETAENVNITRVPAKLCSFPDRNVTHGVAAVTDVATWQRKTSPRMTGAAPIRRILTVSIQFLIFKVA